MTTGQIIALVMALLVSFVAGFIVAFLVLTFDSNNDDIDELIEKEKRGR